MSVLDPLATPINCLYVCVCVSVKINRIQFGEMRSRLNFAICENGWQTRDKLEKKSGSTNEFTERFIFNFACFVHN